MRGAAIAALAALSATGAAAESPADEMARRLAPYRPVIEETAQLMYNIGACEAHVRKSDVDFYIREYMAQPKGDDSLASIWAEEVQGIYRSLYVEGRKDASKLNFDATQCKRALDSQVASVTRAAASLPTASARK